jgi:DNA-binding MarR family transcriptional regulator
LAVTREIRKYHKSKFLTNNTFKLWPLLDQARSAVSRSRGLEVSQYGLTMEQAAVLHTLITEGGSATNDILAYIMWRHYTSVTTLVNRMVKIGLVKKNKIPNQRKYKVSITEKGENIYNQLPINSIIMIFSALSSEEQLQIALILEKLINKTRDILGMDYKPPFMQNKRE